MLVKYIVKAIKLLVQLGLILNIILSFATIIEDH